MAKTIDDLFVYLRLITDVLIICFFFSKRIAISQKGFLLIAFYCIYDLVFYIIDSYILLPKDLVAIFYSSFTFIEYLTMAYFIWLFINNQIFKKFIFITSIAFVITLIIYLFFAEAKHIDSIPIGLETVLILIFTFYYLYEQMNNVENDFLYTQFSFWAITGFMVYLAGSFFIYVFAEQIDKQIIFQYWFLTNAFYTLKNILILIGLLLIIRKLKNPHSKNLYSYLN